jgi:hypothetical protein
MVKRACFVAAEARGFERAASLLEEASGQKLSANTIQRLVGDVGRELATRRDADPKRDNALAKRPEAPPELAVVECDGGRIRVREPGHGRGVHLSNEGWRETKNACLIRATRKTFEEDPQPEPPECFCDPKHVARITETQALSPAAARPANPPSDDVEDADDITPLVPEADWRPKRVMRTLLASMAGSKTFGEQMYREAKRRRFFEAPAKAFLGDGLPWNWSIQQQHFRSFTPILDFIHPLSYLFSAAKAAHGTAEADAWDQYVAWMRGCWQGEVAQVIEELSNWQSKLGEPPNDAPESDPRKTVATTVTYLTNNQHRMNYPEYRRQGLPITTAWMESAVKQMNYRVKGTDMFWNDPEGAEPINQVRAAYLSEDGRLKTHLATRPGCPFTRRPKAPKRPEETCKS